MCGGGLVFSDDCVIGRSVYKEPKKVLSPIVRAIFGLSPVIRGTVQCALTTLFLLFNGAGDGPWESLKAPPRD